MDGGPTFLFYLFSNSDYSLIQYQQMTVNNYGMVYYAL
jgi:hypothetical protein